MARRTKILGDGEWRSLIAWACAYFVCADLALRLTRFHEGPAIVWLAGPLLFAALSSSPRRLWVPLTMTCAPAGIAASALFGVGGPAGATLAVLSVCEALATAWLIRRMHPRFGRLESLREVIRFIAAAGVLSPAVTATLAAWLIGSAGDLPYAAVWIDWYAGHALGFLAFAPPILLTARGELRRWLRATRRRRRIEAVLLLAGVLAACAAAFGQGVVPLVVLPLVPMTIATLRLSRFGAVTSIIILFVVGLVCSLMGLGPTTLLPDDMELRLQVLQVYFATVVLVLLPLAADLEARRRLVRRLHTAETMHRLILDRTGDVVLRSGIDGRIRYASPSAQRLWGMNAGDLIGATTISFVAVNDRSEVERSWSLVLSEPGCTTTVEYRVVRADGAVVWVEANLAATVDDGGTVSGMVAVLREMTERRRMVEELAREANTDPLTGLANRRAFDARFTEQLRASASTPGCVAIFDLDHFKRVNDQFGHAAGDELLIRFATVLQSTVRDGDMVARLGGEEFGVLLAPADPCKALAICERVRLELEGARTSLASDTVVHATVSAGVARYEPDQTPREVLARADAALYEAKTAGRNRVVVEKGN